MTTPSSYVRHLPPALWDIPHGEGELALPDFLRLFEAVLTGVGDRAVGHGDHDHLPLSVLIDRIPLLLDPWKTPTPSGIPAHFPQAVDADFLKWLASWVALELPEWDGHPELDEYQQRKATAEIAAAHRLRGLRRGLAMSVDLFTVAAARPRVTIDDGNKIRVVLPRAGRFAEVASLASPNPVTFGAGVDALIAPQCLALAPNGDVIVGDTGITSTAATMPEKTDGRVWRMAADTGLLSPRPLLPFLGAVAPPAAVPPAASIAPRALAIHPAQAGRAEQLYVLEQNRLIVYDAPYDKPESAKAVGGTPLADALVEPIAMAVQPSGEVIILDRGKAASGIAAETCIITVTPQTWRVATHQLPDVKEPLALLMRSDKELLIGDGGTQTSLGAGALVRVKRDDSGRWKTDERFAGGPLVAPTGIVAAPGNQVYVLDAGLRPFIPEPGSQFDVLIAEQAAVYLMDVVNPVSAERLTEAAQFVYPVGMVGTPARLLVCDPGQPERSGGSSDFARTRVRPFTFGVVVHFTRSAERPGEDEDPLITPEQRQARVRAAIARLIQEQKPAHTVILEVS